MVQPLSHVQLLADARERPPHAGASRIRVAIPGQEQQARVHLAPGQRSRVAAELLAVPEGFHFLADERAIGLEQLHRRPQVVAVVQLEKTVERRPAEHPRMGEVPALAADLPDSLIRFAPPFAGEPAKADERLLRIAIESPSAVHEVRRRADDLAVHVELELLRGRIPDAHRPRAAMTAEVR